LVETPKGGTEMHMGCATANSGRSEALERGLVAGLVMLSASKCLNKIFQLRKE